MFKRLRFLLTGRRAFEQSMTEELQFHIDQYTDDLVRSGLTREEASRRARLELGGLNTVKDNCRQARGLQLYDELIRQLRYAFRLFRKTPGLTATAVLTLAVCLGANLTIFAVIDSILIRALPFPASHQLVTIFNTYPKAGVMRDGASITNYYERRGHIPAFSSISIYRFGTAIVGDPGSTASEQVTEVSPDFFTTLAALPRMGRPFNDEETTYKTNTVAIVSDSYWHRYFNSDPQVIGKQLRVYGVAKTIIGVLPPGFQFLSSKADLYFPLASSQENRSPLQRHSGGNVIQMIARLAPNTTIQQAQAQIDAQNTALERDDPQAKMMADAGFRSLVVSLHADQVATVRPTLLLLQTAVIVLLLIGIVNLANLLLIRASARSKEVAVRQAIGAGRAYLISEILLENTLLTLMGGLLGLALSAVGIRLLTLLGTDRLPFGSSIVFDSRLAIAALLASLAAGLLLSVPIIWFNLRTHPGAALQSETRGGSVSRPVQTLRHIFVVAQIALAFVLLAGAGLLGLSLKEALAVSPGFRPDHTLTGKISLPDKDYPTSAARLAFIKNLTEKLEAQPGSISAGVINNVPLSGRDTKSAANVEGHVLRPGESPRGHYSYGVSGNYFRAIGVPLIAGRFLEDADSQRPTRVCVVDDDFARYYWPNQNPLGRRLFEGAEPGKDSEAFTVVGVVGSIRQADLTEDIAQGAIYYPYVWRNDDPFFVVLRTSLPPDSLSLSLRNAVRQLDASLPVTDLRTMDTRIADSLLVRRSPAILAAAFSAIAIFLTALGAYGVMSYAVSQRRREIGVRMALGAQPRQIGIQYFSLAMRLVAGGLLLGVIIALLSAQAVQAVLYHVPALPLLMYAASIALITLVCIAASVWPAHRASRISPMHALSDQ